MTPDVSYLGYPEPEEAPVTDKEATKYHDIPENNPILSGLPLLLLAKLVKSIGPLQTFFWYNTGFDVLRRISVLQSFKPRYEPLVIPLAGTQGPAGDDPPLFSEVKDATFYTSADYVTAYTTGRTTPVDVAQYLLSLAKVHPHSLAFVEVREDLTLEAARASANRYTGGIPKSPLDGVPFVVKDEVDVHGYKTTYGSAKIHNEGEGETAWAVQKLQQAGAVLLGKVNMHELGTDPTNNNPVKGTPRNPYNKGYYTGGSSGGPAYAVGAGLVPFAVGADGGGSIRIPASYCGVYGIKPSHGRVSARPSIGLSPGNGVISPIASSLQDLTLTYRIMSEPDPHEPSSAAFPPPRELLIPITIPQRKLLGIYRTWFNDSSKDVTSICNSAVEKLVSTRGYEVIELPAIPYFYEGRISHALSIMTEIANFVKGDVSPYNAANQIFLSVGSKTPALHFALANKMRNLFMSHFAALWQKYPGLIIVTPTSPLPGVKIKESHLSYGVSDTNHSLTCMRYVFLANFIGTPSLNAPVGYLKDNGIPVALMGVSEWGKEEELFGWGKDVEDVFLSDTGRKRGELWVDVLGGIASDN